MATKTIDHLGFRMDVTPYEHEGNTFNRLSVSVGYQKGRGFYVTLHPVLTDGGELYDFSRNPLSDTTWFDVEQATKNNSKRLTAIYENVKQGQEAVRLCFDARKWERMEFIIVNLAAHGYADWLKEAVGKFSDTLKEQDELAENPMMKQWRDLKSKHKDAILLFRCGDFYETYEDDAKECAKVLGITLTYRQGDGVPMAGFPHHALDKYLPVLIRTGHRVAICDQLDPPPGPRPKRGTTTETTEDNNSSTNNQNSEDKVMTNETTKVADLIGKSISNGGNAKYTINSIEGDKVSVTFQMGDSEGKPMTMGVAQVEKLLQGGWQVSDDTQEPTEKEAPKTEEPKAKTVKMESEPKPKQEKPKAEKPKVTLRKKQPQTEEPETKAGKLTYATYTNSKGKVCAKISGFALADAAYQKEAAASLHGSATYENTKQGRVNFLLFGPRYAEVAKTVCQMLNEGKAVGDCQAVVDAATEERMARREEWKQKREAYRQEHESKAQETKPQGKVYTEAEMLDLMERVMRGDADALAEVNAIKAKAA